MKKRLFLTILLLVGTYSYGQEEDCRFEGALSSGFVFKHDCSFKEVYGHGLIDVITADGCYYPWQRWGIGAKVSYWRRDGKTTFLKRCARAQEVPFTVYLRRRKTFECGTRLYASLGGGVIWVEEKSYLGKAHKVKGIGEAEIGLNRRIWRCIDITGAVRYLFPRQELAGRKVDVGGVDLRAGFGVQF